MAPRQLAAGPRAGRAVPAQQAASGTHSHLCSPGGCRFSWKPPSCWMTFSSPPTESAFYLLFGMQSNRTPCEFYLSLDLLYGWGSCLTGLSVLAADCGVVSGLSGRNLGGRAQLVKFEFQSHTESTTSETHCRQENPLSRLEPSPSLVGQRGWTALLC